MRIDNAERIWYILNSKERSFKYRVVVGLKGFIFKQGRLWGDGLITVFINIIRNLSFISVPSK
jgi:hypothetical protein